MGHKAEGVEGPIAENGLADNVIYAEEAPTARIGGGVAIVGDDALDVIDFRVERIGEDDDIAALNFADAISQAIDDDEIPVVKIGLHAAAIDVDAGRDEIDHDEHDQSEDDGLEDLEQDAASLRFGLGFEGYYVLSVERADFSGVGEVGGIGICSLSYKLEIIPLPYAGDEG
jgi:hypothetical protein